ncbi:TPA: hypothetical protein ACH3X1_006950 [Trebouxia sp. C0004]
MRSAPRQSSKRHKQLPSHVLQPQQHVSQAAKAADAMSMQVYSEADRADAAQPQQALQYQVKDTIIAAWPLMLGQAQKPGVSWTKPLLRPPQLQLPLPPPATIRSDSMPSAQPAAVTSLVHAPSLASAAGNAGHAVSVRSRQNPYTAENQPMMVDCQGWEQQADTSGSGGASDLAAKLQCMQADARAGAWSQHKGHGLTKGKSQRDHAPACTVANVGLKPQAVFCAPVVANAAARAAGKTEHASDSMPRTCTVTRQHSGRQRSEAVAEQPQPDSVSLRTADGVSTAAWSLSAVRSSDSQPMLRMTSDLDLQNAQAANSSTSGSLSLDTESLVAKLRALSQGKGESAPAKASKPDGQQHQRFPFASRTTNSCQPPDKTKPGMSASHLGASAPKRSKPSEVSGGAPAVVHTAKAAAGPVDQQGQESGRCIRLMEPVHSGTALDSRSCPQQRSHRLRSPAGSPAGSSRHRSSYTSVGPPIPVGPQPCAPAAVDIPAAPVGRAEATANTGQEQPEAAVQHRLGKATPLKKSFTPRPSRFRLEAERLSVTPPDKSSGLEKVLFRSPSKAERPAEQLQGKGNDDKVSCTGSGHIQEAAQPMEESCHTVKAEAQPSHMLIAESDNECSMVTPANQLQSGAQHAPQGVFSGMHIILDPELTAEENSRMHEAVRAGGGQVVGGAYLGSGATHVICHPQAAVKWLAMGLSIVSPAWLLRSLAQGTPDRCLHMSLDASRHLPPSVKSRQAQGSSLAPSADGVAFPQDLADRQARQTFVQQLQDQEVHQQWGLAQQALPTPQTMLDEVLWCVTDAPETARLDTLHLSTGHSYRGGGQDVEVADYSSTMSATQEACQAELDKADAMCSSSGFSGSAAASSEASDGLPGRQLQEGDWQEIVYKAPALTLLLPLDSIGACGHRSRSLHIPPCGCSRRHMLHSIYSFYQEVLSVSDQLQMMHSSSGAANVVKEVFVEGAPVKHMALLGAKVNLEGLERVSRDLTGTIYELKLSC